MAFSSDWSQPTNLNHQLHENRSNDHELLSHQSLPSNPNSNHHHTSLSTRHDGSMVEKARQAKLPPPEGALKCPRCNSNNTKFCYYNNYNLTQPRHFCKACRRYWTHGGALRNVPVGGGCRRNYNNKKGKNGNSKSSLRKQASMVNAPGPSSGQLRTNHLYNLTHLGVTNSNNQAHQIVNELGFLHDVENGRNTSAPVTENIHENNNLMASLESLNQFALFDPTTKLYDFQNNDINVGISSSSSSMVNSKVYQAATLKMEDQTKLFNSSKPVTGLISLENQRNQYFWTGSGFSCLPNEFL